MKYFIYLTMKKLQLYVTQTIALKFIFIAKKCAFWNFSPINHEGIKLKRKLYIDDPEQDCSISSSETIDMCFRIWIQPNDW